MYPTTQFDELKSAVATEQLLLCTIISMARSCSTVLLQSILNAPGVMGSYNEPFFDKDIPGMSYDAKGLDEEKVNAIFEDGCREILALYQTVKKSTETKTVQLVIKEHSLRMTLEQFKKLSSLSKNILFSVRSPAAMCQSLMVCLANDFFTPEGKGLTKEDVKCLFENISKWHSIEDIDAELKNKLNEKLTMEDLVTKKDIVLTVIKTFLPYFWQNMEKFYEYLQEQGIPFVIVDEALLRMAPEECVLAMTKQLKDLSYDDTMINWKKLLASDDPNQRDKPRKIQGERNALVWKEGISHSRGIEKREGAEDVKAIDIPCYVDLSDSLNVSDAVYVKMQKQPQMLKEEVIIKPVSRKTHS